jgi:hypothetical protein
MGGIVNQVGQDVKKAASAVAGELTHLKAPVPPPPDFDWNLLDKVVNADVADLRAKREDEEVKRKQAASVASEQASKAGEAGDKAYYSSQYRKLSDEYLGLDMSTPEGKKKADELYNKMKVVLAGYSGHAPIEKYTYAGAKLTEAATRWNAQHPDDRIDPSVPLQNWSSDWWEKTGKVFEEMGTKEQDTIGTDEWGDRKETRKITRSGDAIPTPPSKDFGAPSKGGGGSTGARPLEGEFVGEGPRGPSKNASKAELLYWDWARTNTPPAGANALNHVRAWATKNGLRDPAILKDADRKALAGLDNLDDAIKEIEPYINVLGDKDTKYLLARVSSQLYTTPEKSVGLVSGIERLAGLGVDQAFVNRLSKNPEASKFFVRYNRLREAVMSLRPYQGNMRATGQLYSTLQAQVPDPASTGDPTQAADKLMELKRTISAIRKRMGLDLPDDGAGGNQKTTGADPLGGDSLPVAVPR